MESEQQIREKFEALSGYLSEAGLRIWVATEAKALGRGGISTVARATGLSRTTIHSGLKDLSSKELGRQPKVSGRIRVKGGGRKKLVEKDPGLLLDLDSLVEPASIYCGGSGRISIHRRPGCLGRYQQEGADRGC